MQRTGQQRSVSVRSSSVSPSVDPNAAVVSVRLLDERSFAADAEHSMPDDDKPRRGTRLVALETEIQQRIESRLEGRVRNLAVRIEGDVVILSGECSTFYSKQLAQHAAMGILEDQQLENSISVCVPR